MVNWCKPVVGIGVAYPAGVNCVCLSWCRRGRGKGGTVRVNGVSSVSLCWEVGCVYLLIMGKRHVGQLWWSG